MNEFKIESKGKLYLYKWNPKTQKTDKKDVSKKAYKHLFQTCTLADDVILKDIFLLMNKNLKKFDDIFGYWCAEIVTEGLKKSNDNDSSIKYLELYWLLFKDSSKNKKISGNTHPSFHGVGKKTMYGLDYSKANDLAHFPLKLKDKPVIQNQSETADLSQMTQYGLEYSLGQILFGVIWELSYHGSPEKRDKQTKALSNG